MAILVSVVFYVIEDHWVYSKRANPNDRQCADSYGTDLNQNYDWMWGDTSKGRASEDPCDEDYHGAGPLSEPESRAVVEYAMTLFPEGQRKDDPVVEAEAEEAYEEEITVILFMDVHSYGGLTYYPWGYEDAVDCDSFESTVSPDNLNTLMYVVKLAKRPNALAKGPNILDLSVLIDEEGVITTSVEASDSELVNIDGYDSFHLKP